MHSQFNLSSLSSQPHIAGPNAALSITMRSEIDAISGAVDWLMTMIQECNCVTGHERDVEIALREALTNAVLHGNHQDAEKFKSAAAFNSVAKCQSLSRTRGKGLIPARCQIQPSSLTSSPSMVEAFT